MTKKKYSTFVTDGADKAPNRAMLRAVGFTNSGIAAGTLFGYAVAALIIANYSWEWVFYTFGALGFFWYFF